VSVALTVFGIIFLAVGLVAMIVAVFTVITDADQDVGILMILTFLSIGLRLGIMWLAHDVFR
jgi:hypothetical protein